jgi:hypothetical protein
VRCAGGRAIGGSGSRAGHWCRQLVPSRRDVWIRQPVARGKTSGNAVAGGGAPVLLVRGGAHAAAELQPRLLAHAASAQRSCGSGGTSRAGTAY